MAHLQPMETPSGKFLLCHHVRVWTPSVSADGSNGRSRYAIQTANGSGPRMRPWPIGAHLAPAIIDYHTPSLDDMVAAVKLASSEIRSPELVSTTKTLVTHLRGQKVEKRIDTGSKVVDREKSNSPKCASC